MAVARGFGFGDQSLGFECISNFCLQVSRVHLLRDVSTGRGRVTNQHTVLRETTRNAVCRRHPDRILPGIGVILPVAKSRAILALSHTLFGIASEFGNFCRSAAIIGQCAKVLEPYSSNSY